MQLSTSQKSESTGFDFLPSVVDDTYPVYSGLFNEVISSSMARYKSAEASQEDQEEMKN